MTPVKLFDGDEVTKSTDEEGNDSWTYENTRYWMPDATYNFYAYSCADIALQSKDKGTPVFNVPATVTEGSKLDARGLKINSYICDATHQHDLIVATAEQIRGYTSNNTKVKFSFKHALCKVSAEFINDFPQGYTITVSNVKLRNFYNRANLNVRSLKDQITIPENPSDADMKKLQDGIWSGQARIAVQDEDPSVEEMTELELTVNNNVSDPVFMLPVYYDNANLQIEFTITVAQGNDIFLSRTLRGTWKPIWIPGRAYKYDIHINGENAQLEPIVFETSQDITGNESWGANITTDMTFGMIKDN